MSPAPDSTLSLQFILKKIHCTVDPTGYFLRLRILSIGKKRCGSFLTIRKAAVMSKGVILSGDSSGYKKKNYFFHLNMGTIGFRRSGSSSNTDTFFELEKSLPFSLL